MLITRPDWLHQNFWFIPCFLISLILYIVLASFSGARKKYPTREKEENEYDAALQKYANDHFEGIEKFKPYTSSRILTGLSWATLAGILVIGVLSFANVFDPYAAVYYVGYATIVYFILIILVSILDAVKMKKELNSK